MDANKTAGEKDRRQLYKNAASNIEQVLAATAHKAPTIRLPTSHHENYPSSMNRFESHQELILYLCFWYTLFLNAVKIISRVLSKIERKILF